MKKENKVKVKGRQRLYLHKIDIEIKAISYDFTLSRITKKISNMTVK
jgi:hypothetical protein